MDDLVQFIRDRYDEDEATARGADPHLGNLLSQVEYLDADVEADQRHIARHDPARVLREVEAKRLILERFADLSGENWKPSAPRVVRLQELRDSVRCLALAYADHPDYREDWRP